MSLEKPDANVWGEKYSFAILLGKRLAVYCEKKWGLFPDGVFDVVVVWSWLRL